MKKIPLLEDSGVSLGMDECFHDISPVFLVVGEGVNSC